MTILFHQLMISWLTPPIYRTSSDEFSDCSELKSTIWLIQPFLKNAGHINHYKPPWTKWVNSQSTTRFSMYREFKSKKTPIFYTLIRLNPISRPRPNPLQLTYNVSSSHKMALSIRFGFPYTIYTLMVFFGVPMKPWWLNPHYNNLQVTQGSPYWTVAFNLACCNHHWMRKSTRK